MTREEARDYINEQQPTFLQEAKKGYICPKCGNGTGSTGDGITADPKRGRYGGGAHYKCFKCGLYADVIELYGIANNIEDYRSQLLEAGKYYGITIDQEPRTGNQNQPKTEQKHSTQSADYTDFFREAHSHLQETNYHRGISLETLNRFNVGYIESWKHPKAPKMEPSPRLIIPITRGSYIARYAGAGHYTDYQGQKQDKSKVGAGGSWIYNARALETAKKPVFITEGELDALSLIDLGAEAVALGSTAYKRQLIDLIKERKPSQPLIIALDNDKAGQEAGKELTSDLRALNIETYYCLNLYGTCKDANEALTTDRENLQSLIETIYQADNIEDAIQRDIYIKQNSVGAHLQSFIDGIAESVNTPYISTGFPALDNALEGGLTEGLIIMGAISSLGKTTLALQIADQVAQSGQDVLIFSLEMARNELIAKSISRHTAQHVLTNGGRIGDAKTTRGITTGSRYAEYSTQERELINTAIMKYAEYADHLFIIEGMGDISTKQMREVIDLHKISTGRTPLIILDYLQILSPYNEKYNDKQNTDRNVTELKRISRDYKTPVIAISSLNRQNYKEAISMEAFKESGSIEYSADILIGLQLSGAGEKDFDPTEEKKKDPRSIDLVILKHRNGKTGEKVKFKYYPMFNLFQG